MSTLPHKLKKLFAVIYGLFTFTFVALVAYAATAGAFGAHDGDGGAMKDSECEARVVEIHEKLVKKGVAQMAPYLDDRLADWNQADQKWARELGVLKKSCTRLALQQQIQALGQLQQAYTTAIRGFETRGRDAILRLQPTHAAPQ
jgi:hypothetical protein